VRVVIDANVARASGGVEATHLVARASRDALRALLDGGGTLFLGEDGWGEWRKHMSPFARKWLVRMHGRKRVERKSTLPHKATRRAAARALAPADRAAVIKDAHLVDAAFASDRRVVSLDETTRNLLCVLAAVTQDLRSLYWVSPVTPRCVPWLEAGAPDDPGLRIAPRA